MNSISKPFPKCFDTCLGDDGVLMVAFDNPDGSQAAGF